MFISSVVGRGTTSVGNADGGDEEEGLGIGEVTKDISGTYETLDVQADEALDEQANVDDAANFLLPMKLICCAGA